MDNNMTLDEMMGRPSRTGVGVTMDLTASNNQSNVRTNDNDHAKATVVNNGPIDMSTAKSIDIHDILPSRAQTVSVENNPLMAELDAAIAREKISIDKRIDAVLDAQDEERRLAEEDKEIRAQDAEDGENTNGSTFNEDDDDEYGLYDDNIEGGIIPTNRISVDKDSHYNDDFEKVHETNAFTGSDNNDDLPFTLNDKPDNAVATPNPEVRSVNILDNIEDDELFDDEDTPATQVTSEEETEIIEGLKRDVKSKITPIKNKINLAAFTIAKKAESVQKVMKLAVNVHRNVADWVLYSAGRPISVTGLSGAEILKLNPENSSRNRLNTFRDMYRVIYEHVYDANKPDFEVWLKQIRFVDLRHLYFALYMATFGGSNFVSYSCPNTKCNKIFIKDIEFKDMVVYANDEVKAHVQNMLKMDTTSNSNDSYPIDLVQISDNYVFGLRTPSVWDVIIETSTLSDKFMDKHADLLDVVAYIDSVYYIDHNNSTLIPVDTKPVPNDMAKTSARRIKAFYDIIRSLSSEEYTLLRAKINEYDKVVDKIKYHIPACTCPECATEIPANEDITPEGMLFMRHQLAAIGNM